MSFYGKSSGNPLRSTEALCLLIDRQPSTIKHTETRGTTSELEGRETWLLSVDYSREWRDTDTSLGGSPMGRKDRSFSMQDVEGEVSGIE